MNNGLLIIIILILLAMWGDSDADMFKCGNTWVHTGDSVSKVRSKCGRPNWQDTNSSEGSRTKRESWEYGYNKTGSGTLNFKNGKLISVDKEIR